MSRARDSQGAWDSYITTNLPDSGYWERQIEIQKIDSDSDLDTGNK